MIRRILTRRTPACPSRAGFTIIELTLSMSFIGVLLVTIFLVTTNVISIYQKGVTIKSVNSVGKELVDDFSRTISATHRRKADTLCSSYANTAAAEACRDNNGYNLIYQQQYASVGINGEYKTVPTHGAFCTGLYTYLWNSGYVLGDDSEYENGASHRASYNGDSNFRVLKIADPANSICFDHTNQENARILASDSYTGPTTGITELIHNTDEDLAIYDLQIFPPTWHNLTDHTFYSGTFILATIRGTVDITGSGDYCTETPTGLGTDFNYCAINKFNFAMRATGEDIDED